MAVGDEVDVIANAFSGFGVDEKSLITILGKWHPEQTKSFRKGSQFFIQDERLFERWIDKHVEQLKIEFLRFKSAVVLWTMHPWERDARLIKDAVMDGQKSTNVIVEIACTRSCDDLFGARKAYHSLFDRSIEEDVAYNTPGIERMLLVALVSSYRYEGPRFHEDSAKSEAKTLCTAIKDAGDKNPMDDQEVVRILSTRSKPHLKAVFKHYKEISGKNIDEDLVADSSLKHTVQCLSTPHAYFIKVLDAAMNPVADENTKEGLTRVLVTRADVDMKLITEEYHKQNGVTLTQKIEQMVKGNFKEFLLTLLARGGAN
ncbi:annexin D4-like isoform X1 [Actinidia eriantha]|uniref:annexin D4-like isoform X1 n=1 Tax=Actinidia eriantha TaxID=165200 RepID=UPI00259057AB|nr:annexin D4-like isoform X1 [Actinidia eriantha]